MTKFRVSTKELLAARVFSRDGTLRRDLEGVLIEVGPESPPLMVATDGWRIAVIKTDCHQDGMTGPAASFTLTNETVERIGKFADGLIDPDEIVIEFHPKHETIVVHFANGTISTEWKNGAALSGNCLDWRKVIPTTEKTPVLDMVVNPDFFADLKKAALLLGIDESIRIGFYGANAPCEVYFFGSTKFYSLVMPLRSDSNGNWRPKFIPQIESKPTAPPIEPVKEGVTV